MTTDPQRSARFVTRCMAALAEACGSHARWVLSATAVLFVVAGYAALHHLRYESDRNLVLANSASYYSEYQAFKREFGASDALYFMISGPDRAQNHRVALEIGRRARADSTRFANVVDRIDLSFVRQRLLLFVPLPELEALESSIRAARPILEHLVKHPGLAPLFAAVNHDVQVWLQSVIRSLRAELPPSARMTSAPPPPEPPAPALPFVQAVPVFTQMLRGMTSALTETVRDSPLAALLSRKSRGLSVADARDIWLEFQDGKTVLVSAEAQITGDRTHSIDAAVQAARRLVDELSARYPTLKFAVTGTPAIDSDEMRQSEIDSIHATLLSLLGVVLLFWVGFRNLTRPLLALAALVVSLVWTLGFVAVTLGHLNLLTVTALPMLVGLGIDFGIQVISRYEEERNAGLEPSSAMSDTLQYTGASILTAGLTAAISFGVVYLSGFVGVQEMAIVAGAGILFGVLCMVVVLPSLILAGERTRFHRADAKAMRVSTWRALEALEQRVLDYPRITIALATLFTALCISRLHTVRYDWNLLHLQDPSSPSVRAAMQLMEACGRPILWVATTADTPEEASRLANRFRTLDTVGDVLSIAPLIPPQQAQRLEIVRRIQASLAGFDTSSGKAIVLPPVDVKALASDIGALRRVALVVYPEAERAGGLPASQALHGFVAAADAMLQTLEAAPSATSARHLDRYQKTLFDELFETLSTLSDPKAATPITVDTLPAPLRRQFVGRHGGAFMVQVIPCANVWERSQMETFIEQVRHVAPNVTGPAVEVYESSGRVKAGYEEVTVYAFIAIVILTLIHFGTLSATLLALLPLGLGVIWMLGIQGMAGLPFNGANMLALSIILGIGVANGIYIVRRFHEEGRPTIFTQSTGRAILMSNLSALIGFGSLLVSAYRGMYSFGLLMSIGVVSCMVASLVVLPSLLSLPWFQAHRPAEAPPTDG